MRPTGAKSMNSEPSPAESGVGPVDEQSPPSGSGVGAKVGAGVAVTIWVTTRGVGGTGVGSGVLVGGSVGMGVLVGRSVAVGEGGGVAVAVGGAVGSGVLVGGIGVGVGTGVFVGGAAVGVGVGVTVGVGYPMKIISKSVFRAPLWKSSSETDLKPFRKNSIGWPIKLEEGGAMTRF